MTNEELIQLVTDAGATAAAYIKTEDFVLSEEFRKICEANQCGQYGKCYMCPPFVGESEALMDKLRTYPGGILYQSIGKLEDSFDYEGMMEAAGRHMELTREIQRRLRAAAPPRRMLHLSKGGCNLCETCGAIDGTPCRFPNLVLSSLEAYCIDVYQTSKAAGLKYMNGPGTVTYFGLLLFEN